MNVYKYFTTFSKSKIFSFINYYCLTIHRNPTKQYLNIQILPSTKKQEEQFNETSDSKCHFPWKYFRPLKSMPLRADYLSVLKTPSKLAWKNCSSFSLRPLVSGKPPSLLHKN
jgi:hypothetical protein